MPQYKSFQDYLDHNYKGPFSATDIIIRYNDREKEGIVLISRKYPPLGLALPGGMAERQTFDKNAIDEAKQETGLDVILDNVYHPLCVLSEVDQDPRAHIASITYTARGDGTIKPFEEEDAKWARLFTLKEVEEMLPQTELWAFPKHHRQILRIYLEDIQDPNYFTRLQNSTGGVNYGRK